MAAKRDYKCDCCRLNPAEVKDCRENPATGDLDKFYVCRNCLHLNDYWFYKLLEAEDKKHTIQQILGGRSWEEWLL